MYQAFGLAQKLSTADLLQALGQSPPLSVTMKEHVDGLRDWARGRCSSAD